MKAPALNWCCARTNRIASLSCSVSARLPAPWSGRSVAIKFAAVPCRRTRPVSRSDGEGRRRRIAVRQGCAGARPSPETGLHADPGLPASDRDARRAAPDRDGLERVRARIDALSVPLPLFATQTAPSPVAISFGFVPIPSGSSADAAELRVDLAHRLGVAVQTPTAPSPTATATGTGRSPERFTTGCGPRRGGTLRIDLEDQRPPARRPPRRSRSPTATSSSGDPTSNVCSLPLLRSKRSRRDDPSVTIRAEPEREVEKLLERRSVTGRARGRQGDPPGHRAVGRVDLDEQTCSIQTR